MHQNPTSSRDYVPERSQQLLLQKPLVSSQIPSQHPLTNIKYATDKSACWGGSCTDSEDI